MLIFSNTMAYIGWTRIQRTQTQMTNQMQGWKPRKSLRDLKRVDFEGNIETDIIAKHPLSQPCSLLLKT
jgi:hypothetical protein